VDNSILYSVEIGEFANRYFIKTFRKKHKAWWDKTEISITEVCKRIDKALKLQRADEIKRNEPFILTKLDFAIAGTRVSPKSSGNRCILHVDTETHSVLILLAYSKNDITGQNETNWWKQLVKDNYPEIAEIYVL